MQSPHQTDPSNYRPYLFPVATMTKILNLIVAIWYLRRSSIMLFNQNQKCLIEKERSRVARCKSIISHPNYLKEKAHTTINEREGRIGQHEQILSSFFQGVQHLYHFRLHHNKYDINWSIGKMCQHIQFTASSAKTRIICSYNDAYR